jgi:hypothetical protein
MPGAVTGAAAPSSLIADRITNGIAFQRIQARYTTRILQVVGCRDADSKNQRTNPEHQNKMAT